MHTMYIRDSHNKNICLYLLKISIHWRISWNNYSFLVWNRKIMCLQATVDNNAYHKFYYVTYYMQNIHYKWFTMYFYYKCYLFLYTRIITEALINSLQSACLDDIYTVICYISPLPLICGNYKSSKTLQCVNLFICIYSYVLLYKFRNSD